MYTPSIPKKADSTRPLDQRLLSIFSAIYRVEIGAWYQILSCWFRSHVHPSVHGGIKGHEPLDASWDAQADIEHALLQESDIAIASVGYFKYFDSFEHEWVHGFLVLIGFPQALADMVLDLYRGLHMTIKMGKALGEPHHYHNGCGQGDVCALFPAIALVSGQFYMVEALFPNVRMGAVIDDRNFRGDLKDIEKVYHLVHEFDIAAGQSLQDEKTIITSTSASKRDDIKKLDLYGHHPSCPDFFVMVGNLMTTLHKHLTIRLID